MILNGDRNHIRQTGNELVTEKSYKFRSQKTFQTREICSGSPPETICDSLYIEDLT